jgi:choline dehydrogenase-like flavoprotein
MAHEVNDYDYIVIGGGLAGCVVASRLHERTPSLYILVIEAGPKPDGHPLTSAPLACFRLHHTDLDWDYKTVPQKHLDGRECYAAAGKVLSGGNAINYGCWTRGPKADYDHWANLVDDQRWNYDGLLPYFKKSEHHYGDAQQDSEQHGFDGPIYTEINSIDPDRKYPLRETVGKALKAVGVKEIEDGNSGYPLGMSNKVENWRDGQRQPVNQVYDQSGIHFMTETLVARISISVKDGTKTATGVKLVDGRHLHAKKEIIVSAGTYRSPQLLMLSGIGPSAELSYHGIPIIQDSPAVGQNFLDHLGLCTWWKLRHPEQGLAMGTKQWTNPAMYKGLPSDWIVASRASDSNMKIALDADHAPDDVKTHLLDPTTPHTETLISYAPAGADHAQTPIPIDGSHMGACILGMATTSRGRITLRSSDPKDAPVIDPNYYATETDRVALRAGIREVLALMATSQMKEVIECETPPPGFPALSVSSTDEEIDARVRRAGNSFYHPAGSCSMGAVVDTKLKVRGINGLRVCDASVIPTSMAAHLQVPVLAVAEKGADLIAEDVGGRQ